MDLRDINKKEQRSLKIGFPNGEIGCHVLGNGKNKAIVFYGFGQTSEDFINIADALDDYTFYVLDLPFHGKTTIVNPAQPIKQREILSIVRDLKDKECITKFSLMGCSIGARMLFQIIEYYSKDLSEIILFAPDGIRDNIWFRLATQTALSRFLFRNIIRSDKLLPNGIAFIKALKIVDSKTASFAVKSMNNRAKREKVYNTWCYLRKLEVNLRRTADILNELSIKISFVVGKRDKVIPLAAISRLSSKLKNCHLIELDAGHHNVLQKYVEYLEIVKDDNA